MANHLQPRGLGSAGIPSDTNGNPMFDPSKNVLDKFDDAVKRLDDLRILDAGYVKQIADLRAVHAKELRQVEAARLDAIRVVDKNAVDTANLASIQQAAALAGAVTASAEALRVQVAAAATATAASQATAL